jgi:hypothetical protein
MYQEALKFIEQLGPQSLDVLKISGIHKDAKGFLARRLIPSRWAQRGLVGLLEQAGFAKALIHPDLGETFTQVRVATARASRQICRVGVSLVSVAKGVKNNTLCRVSHEEKSG